MAAPSPSLIYIDDDLPGISRQKWRGHWRYHNAKGTLIGDAQEIARLNAIALPPAYVDAWFCPAANGHILATGIDARGRKQYRYHPDFRATREAEKYDRCAAFGHALPLLRQRLEQDLALRPLSRARIIAAVVRLLDTAALRVGNRGYSIANKSFGATTLRMRHAKVSGHTLMLHYRAKGGVQRDVRVTDRQLAALVRRMGDLPGQQLFQYSDEAGVHPVTSSDVNDYIRTTMGGDFTAKHFRTWAGSTKAFEHLVEQQGHPRMKAMLADVSDRLGNTPAIARSAYIHPALLDLAEGKQPATKQIAALPRATRHLSRYERGLLAFLDNVGSQSDLQNAA